MKKSNIKSLIIPFPSAPIVTNELETTTKERLAMYDIITKAFMYKYTYEKAKLQGKEYLIEDKNINKVGVFSKFLSEINKSIRDPFLREFVIASLRALKNNNYANKNVQATYETVRTWFCPDNLKGKIFRNNLASGNSYTSIDFKTLFTECNKEPITEKSPCFAEVKKEYNKYKQQYDDLLK
ncbi:MAG: hypothetical protein E7376_05220 [Clostridiales bacterium]|nr:hypothetical protein [Clostridiales bacterium]